MRVAVVGSPPFLDERAITGRGASSACEARAGRSVQQFNEYGDNTPGQLGALPPGALDAAPAPPTTAPVTTWQGCYSDGWQELIVPEAFCHPAKVSKGLSHRIYRHLLDSGYVRPGDTILDPFAGIGGFCLDAMTYGLHWVGIELEPRFVALGQQNLDLWRQRYGFTGGTLVQGDSRQLRSVLAGAQVGCVVGSPPFSVCLHQSEGGMLAPHQQAAHGRNEQAASVEARSYGTTPGQLGAMPPGSLSAVVSSPPYARSVHDGNGIDHAKLTGNPPGPHTQAAAESYGHSAGQLGAMPIGAVVSSPPYAEGLSKEHTYTDHAKREKDSHRRIMTEKGIVDPFYGVTPGQLGAEPDTFWAASAQIMAELAALLPPGAVCAWVLKAYVSKKAIVPFPDQWRALCEAHGFVLVEEIHASLVEHHGTQEGLFDGPQQVTTEKKSFFRRLAEKKGSPRIDYETVLILRKAGDRGGLCVVSSPPFSVPGCQPPNMRAHAPVRQKWVIEPDRQDSYGTTPGNLGTMPVGRGR